MRWKRLRRTHRSLAAAQPDFKNIHLWPSSHFCNAFISYESFSSQMSANVLANGWQMPLKNLVVKVATSSSDINMILRVMSKIWHFVRGKGQKMTRDTQQGCSLWVFANDPQNDNKINVNCCMNLVIQTLFLCKPAGEKPGRRARRACVSDRMCSNI